MSETKTDEELAREWMASEHWGGWRVGMVCAVTGQVVVRVDDTANIWSDTLPRVAPPGACPTPDISHPGTRAFLVEDVRMAWASEGVFYLEYIAEGRRRHLGCLDSEDGPANLVGDITETGTLMAALRAAPEKTK